MALLGENVKKLGFGLMRLPRKQDNTIDIEQTSVMVDKFLEAGFTYFDTAFVYEGSEEAAKKALVERHPRESYTLASKLAAWSQNTREEAEAQFATSLERTGAGYFDFYLMHNLGDKRTAKFEEYDIWNFLKKKKEEGLIKHLGFSFHADPEQLEDAIAKFPEVEFIQLQINYADWEAKEIQARACYEVCRKHGIEVVIMEPVKGGLLSNPPEQIAKIFKDAEPDASYASWAIRFAADHEGIMTVLSGMSNIEQMEDNIATMKDFTHLTDGQKEVIAKAQQELAKINTIPCTSCGYCRKVCPNNIQIPGVFLAKNILSLYNNMPEAKKKLNFQLTQGASPVDCIKCGMCEDACPQHIHIRELLDDVVSTFELK